MNKFTVWSGLFAFLVVLLIVACAHPYNTSEVTTVETPRVDGMRVDRCLNYGGGDCGQPAADEFCQMYGFAGASDYSVERGVGDEDPTYALGSGDVCDKSAVTPSARSPVSLNSH